MPLVRDSLCRALAGRAAATVDEAYGFACRQVPELRAVPAGLAAGIRDGMAETYQRSLRSAAAGSPPDRADFAALAATVPAKVELGIRMSVHAAAQEAAALHFLRVHAGLAGVGQHEQLARLVAWFGAAVPLASAVFADAYCAALLDTRRTAELRRALMDALLDERPTAATSVARTAGLALPAAYLVAVIRSVGPGPGSAGHWAAVREATRAPDSDVLGRAEDDGWTLLFPVDGRERARLAALIPAGRGPAPLVAGTAAAPVSALAAARAAAGAAARLAAASVCQPRIAGLADVAVEQAAAADPEAAAHLRARIGLLGGRPDLVTTLEELYRRDLDRGRTADALGISRRTLVDRLTRIGDLVGLSPTSPRGVQVLTTALAITRLEPAGYGPDRAARDRDGRPVAG